VVAAPAGIRGRLITKVHISNSEIITVISASFGCDVVDIIPRSEELSRFHMDLISRESTARNRHRMCASKWLRPPEEPCARASMKSHGMNFLQVESGGIYQLLLIPENDTTF
jgi:hypothetical protein